MVTANHVLAAEAGAQILASGGNAVDAAIATSLALGVVEPSSSGIGGRGYMVIHAPELPSGTVIDGHERAPRKAHAEMYTPIPSTDTPPTDEPSVTRPRAHVVNDANTIGPQAVAVPGVVAALAAAHERYGKASWKSLFEPAIQLAEDGFTVSVPLAISLARNYSKLTRDPHAATVYLPNGQPAQPGDRLVQRDLAATLRSLASNGAGEFYEGAIARSIAETLGKADGYVTRDDLAAYRPRIWDAPLTGSYRGYTVMTVPEATGGITLIQALNLLETFDIGQLEPEDPKHFHLLIESLRIAFRDRLSCVDDPAFNAVPFNGLASKEFARTRSELIDVDRAGNDVSPGDPWAFEDRAPGMHPGSSSVDFSGGDQDTTHFSVIDGNRTALSMTQSLIQAFGSGVMVPGTGILLNNAMFNFNPLPNQIGSIAPWKRAAHFGTPTIILGPDGALTMATGGAGGPKIVTGIVQSLLNVLDHGMTPQDSLTAPRIHNESRDSLVDARIRPHVIADLAGRGHRLVSAGSEYGRAEFSVMNGIKVEPDGSLVSATDVYTDAGAWSVGD